MRDNWQLTFATEQERALLTHNLGGFIQLAEAWQASSRRHAGIVISPRAPIGVLVRRVEAHLTTLSAEYQDDTLLLLTE